MRKDHDTCGGFHSTVNEDDTAEVTWLCPPKSNRLLLFDGSLLHGVVPYIMHRKPEDSETQCPRVTLMMGWWGQHVSKTNSPSLSEGSTRNLLVNLKPNMKMPEWNNSIPSWPRLFEPKHDFSYNSLTHHNPSKGLVTMEGDIWEEVSHESDVEAIESNIQFLGNWFLSSRTEILDQIEYSCSALRDRDTLGSQDESVNHDAVGWITAEELKRLRGEN